MRLCRLAASLILALSTFFFVESTTYTFSPSFSLTTGGQVVNTHLQMESKQQSKRLPQRKLKAINTRLPEPIVKQVRHLAIERGTTFQALVIEALGLFLAGQTMEAA